MSAVAAHGREKVVKSENYHFDPVIPPRPFSQCRSLVDSSRRVRRRPCRNVVGRSLAVLFYGSLQCNKLRKRLSYHCRGSLQRFADIKGPAELYSKVHSVTTRQEGRAILQALNSRMN